MHVFFVYRARTRQLIIDSQTWQTRQICWITTVVLRAGYRVVTETLVSNRNAKLGFFAGQRIPSKTFLFRFQITPNRANVRINTDRGSGNGEISWRGPGGRSRGKSSKEISYFERTIFISFPGIVRRSGNTISRANREFVVVREERAEINYTVRRAIQNARIYIFYIIIRDYTRTGDRTLQLINYRIPSQFSSTERKNLPLSICHSTPLRGWHPRRLCVRGIIGRARLINDRSFILN